MSSRELEEREKIKGFALSFVIHPNTWWKKQSNAVSSFIQRCNDTNDENKLFSNHNDGHRRHAAAYAISYTTWSICPSYLRRIGA